MYNILQAVIEYNNNKPYRITVLAEMSRGDVRALFASTKISAGYLHILGTEPITDALLQRVAAYGRETVDRDKIFRGWKRKYLATK